MKVLSTVIFTLFFSGFFIAQNRLPLIGLDANHEGVVGWNNRAGNFGHIIPAPYNAFGNDTAYYYLCSRSKGYFDQQGKGGMHGKGSFTGFTNLASKLALYNKTIGDLSIDFSDMDLNSDTRGTEWDLINDTENRTYIGGTFVIKLNQDTLAIGNTPALKMLIDYNSEQTPFDDVITGKTGYTHIESFVNPNYSEATKEISKALLKDVNQFGVRLFFNSIQPAGQTEFDDGTFFAGYFNVADATFETSSIQLPNFTDTLYLCKGDSIVLDAGVGYSNYRWNNNEVSQSITIKEIGNYYVQFDYQNDMYVSKVVKVLAKPTPKISPMNVTVCEYDSLGIGYLKYLADTKQPFYDMPNSADSLSSFTVLSSKDYFYPTEYGCATPFWNKISVNSLSPNPPATYKVLEFCLSNQPIIDSLFGIDSTYRWYELNQGGLPISKSEKLINGKTYYASQLVDGCESTKRNGTLVKVNQPDSIVVQLNPINETSYQLNWEKGFYNLSIAYQVNSQEIVKKSINQTDTILSISGINPGDTLSVNILYADENGCERTYNNINIFNKLSKLNPLSKQFVEIYPNPVIGSGTLYLKTDKQNIEKIRLVSLNGSTIQTWEPTDKLQLDNIPAGMYLLEVLDSTNMTRLKIQIQD